MTGEKGTSYGSLLNLGLWQQNLTTASEVLHRRDSRAASCLEGVIYTGDLKTCPQVLVKRTPRTAYSSTLDYDFFMAKEYKNTIIRKEICTG